MSSQNFLRRTLKAINGWYSHLAHANNIIFIVEDNPIYAKSLHGFLLIRFPLSTICSFPDGETCMMELHRKPRVILMDHLLNTNDRNAATGLSVIKQIKSANPKVTIILLSAQTNLDVFVEAISIYGCTYIRKDEEAFNKVAQIIRRVMQ